MSVLKKIAVKAKRHRSSLLSKMF